MSYVPNLDDCTYDDEMGAFYDPESGDYYMEISRSENAPWQLYCTVEDNGRKLTFSCDANVHKLKLAIYGDSYVCILW